LTFTTPAFVATAPNITVDVKTGIGDWSDAEIKRALVGECGPITATLAGVSLAAIMPAGFYKVLQPNDLDDFVAYLRTVKPVRNEVPAPVYKTAVRCDPYLDVETGSEEAAFADPVKPGADLANIGHRMECQSAGSRGVSNFITGLAEGPALPPRDGTPERTRPALPPTYPTAGIDAWTDPEIGRAFTLRTSRATAEHSSHRWLRLLRRAVGWPSRGDHRLLAYGAAAAMMPWPNRRSTDCPKNVSCRCQRANFVCEIRL
jgi:hypothetical protein